VSIKDRLEKLAVRDPFQFPETWKVPAGQTASQKRYRQELDMWRQWKESKEEPTKLSPLMSSLDKVIQTNVNKYHNRDIYRPAMEAEARNITIRALRRYDPTKAKINTFVTTNLRSLNRYTKQHQNFSRIVESVSENIGPYNRAKDELRETLGYPPTAQQLADKLKWPLKQVERLEADQRRDIIAVPIPGGGADFDPFREEVPRMRELTEILRYDLTPNELAVWEYLTGSGGKPKITSTGKIARRLGWSDSKVSQLRNSVGKKVNEYLAAV
jgi:hypothetical protein